LFFGEYYNNEKKRNIMEQQILSSQELKTRHKLELRRDKHIIYILKAGNENKLRYDLVNKRM
jgi:hypothetical protein